MAEDVRVLGVVVSPDSVRTGDPFILRVRIGGPPGVTVQVPDTLTYLDGLRSLGPVRRAAVPNPGPGGWEEFLDYPLQALHPGTLALPPLRLRVEAPREESRPPTRTRARWVALPLEALQVRSVLPVPAERVGPKPPLRPPPAGGRSEGRIALLALLVAAGSAMAARHLGRRGGGDDRGERRTGGLSPHRRASGLTPGEARARLRRLLGTGHPLEGGPPETLEEAFRLFRISLGEEEEGRTAARTSSEILLALESVAGVDLALVGSILRTGDLHRFGGTHLGPETVREALRDMRRWMEEAHA